MCDCFKGTGKSIIETRTPSDFTRVELHDNIDLVITQDTINKISVAGGEKLLSNLETKFTDDKLIIQNNNKCNWMRSYKKSKFTVYLSAKSLNRIEYFGMGNITSTNTIITDTLMINCWNASGKIDIDVNTQNNFFGIHTGSTDMYVHGTTNDNYLYNASNGFAHLENLHTNINAVVSNTTGDCYVNVDQHLDVKIKYIGNVYYYGNPSTIVSSITGKGQLIKKY